MHWEGFRKPFLWLPQREKALGVQLEALPVRCGSSRQIREQMHPFAFLPDFNLSKFRSWWCINSSWKGDIIVCIYQADAVWLPCLCSGARWRYNGRRGKIPVMVITGPWPALPAWVPAVVVGFAYLWVWYQASLPTGSMSWVAFNSTNAMAASVSHPTAF